MQCQGYVFKIVLGTRVLLLVIILHKKCHYGMAEYYQSWFENIRLQHYEVLMNKTWQKNSKWALTLLNIC